MVLWRKFKDLIAQPDAVRGGGERSSGRERRIAQRRAQRFVEAYLWSDRMAASKPCNVRNLSITGARIDLLGGPVKPDLLTGTLTIYFPGEKREIDCEVMRRVGKSLGIKFVGAYREPSRKYGRG